MATKTVEAIKNKNCGWFYNTRPDDFEKIPGSPVAYFIKKDIFNVFEKFKRIGDYGNTGSGLQTSDNDRFLRQWFEISNTKFSKSCRSREEAKNSGKKWFPHKKGGPFRKWYGNDEYVLNWENDGQELFEFAKNLYGSPTRIIKNTERYFQPGITWSHTTSSFFSARILESGSIFNVEAPSLFDVEIDIYLAFLCSSVCQYLIGITNPTLHFVSGSVAILPFDKNKIQTFQGEISRICKFAIQFSKTDWNNYETAWDFTQNPIIRTQQPNLEQAFNTWQQQNSAAVAEMKRLEEENNKLFIDAYGLQDELTPDVPDEQITLTRANREKDSQRLVSYALGCMMGRYSLDEPGLIYAHAGNQDFDASRYQTFPADADGIIPLTEMHWFEDDATHRIQEFLTAVWGKDTLDANMQWLAESLDKKTSETAEDTIRRYLASKFYKDHMQTYKKRPIYWLFSSGKQGAFQALVYLHRYNESTLARMRTEYVMPLISKMAAMVNSLQSEIENSDSAAEIKRKEKELQNLHKQQAELSSFEEKLRHYADQRISLDLDDGVKVNYGKFGDLLAEVKAVTGEK